MLRFGQWEPSGPIACFVVHFPARPEMGAWLV
jgi:hypothetical protein